MPLSDISFNSLTGVYVDSFDSGRGAFAITTLQIVTNLNKIRDVMMSAGWRANRGIRGAGSISFPLGLPGDLTPIITGLNRFICTVIGTKAPAAINISNVGPYTFFGGEHLLVQVNGSPAVQVITFPAGFLTADQVADVIASQIVQAVPYVSDDGFNVYLETLAVGPDAELTLGGTALAILGWSGHETGTARLPDLNYYFYNSNFEVHPDFGPDAVWIDVAGDNALGGLAGALDNALITSSVSSSTSITIRAKAGGTYSDFVQIIGNGAIDLAGGLTGGGWEMWAHSQKDDAFLFGETSNNDAHMVLKLLSRDDGQPGLRIHVFENHVLRYTFNPQYTPSSTPFNIWANPYSVAFMNSEPAHAGDIYEGNAFLYAGTQRVDPEDTSVVRQWVILYGPSARNCLGISNAFASAITLVDTGAEIMGGGWGQDGFSFCYLHYAPAGGESLSTRAGKALLVRPRFMAPFDVTGEARIVGDFWDAFLYTGYKAPDVPVVMETVSYSAMFAQVAGAVGTVFFKWRRLSGAAMPVKGGYVDTEAASPYRVISADGDQFDASMAGTAISIAGSAYTVATYVDPQHLTLTTSAGSQQGAYFHT